MNWKQLMSIATIIFSIGFLLRSFSPAHALNTPSISTGSNPVFSHGQYTSTNLSHTISGQTGEELMVSDIFIHADSGYFFTVTLQTSSGTVLATYRSYTLTQLLDTHLISPIRVPEGEDLVITTSGRGMFTVSGYRAHS